MTAPPHLQPPAPQNPASRENKLGVFALIVSSIGFVLACIPQTITAGWVTLPIGLILGLSGMLRSGRTRKTSIAAMAVALLGAVASAGIMLAAIADLLFHGILAPMLSDAPQR